MFRDYGPAGRDQQAPGQLGAITRAIAEADARIEDDDRDLRRDSPPARTPA